MNQEIITPNQLREAILPASQVSVRKTIGLNEPGCSVNCTYCTLGVQYTGSGNRAGLRENLFADALSQVESLPPEAHVEFVGYWYGLNGAESNQFADITQLISEAGASRIVGADLGIVKSPRVLMGLKDAGLTYLHNNLETSRRLYPSAIGKSPQRLDDKIATLKNAVDAGLTITSGILIGLGETEEDLQELVTTLTQLPVRRVAVNFMDYQTDSRIGEAFIQVRDQLTPEYALSVLEFLRHSLRPDQSLMVGSGVGMYLYGEHLARALQVVDTLHIGSFINLSTGRVALLDDLQDLGYNIVSPPYFQKGGD